MNQNLIVLSDSEEHALKKPRKNKSEKIIASLPDLKAGFHWKGSNAHFLRDASGNVIKYSQPVSHYEEGRMQEVYGHYVAVIDEFTTICTLCNTTRRTQRGSSSNIFEHIINAHAND
jgi:hypothetical protein